MTRIYDDAVALGDELVALRRRLHAHPEIGLQLPRTQREVLAALDGLPLEIGTGQGLSSVTGVLRGGRPGPAVLVRADMDALPLTERTGMEFESEVDGAMHACGHDLHTTMLVGAAHLLAARRAELAGDVVFMFQPGEEGGCDGAGKMIAEGVLDAAGRRAAAAYAMHVFTTGFAGGVFTTRSGPVMAAGSELDVTVLGTGGHASAPHLARDPVPAVCEMVSALQNLVTRISDPFDPVVLTVGSLHAGTRRNIIPGSARFEATVRTFTDRADERMNEATLKLVRSIAAGHGLDVDATYVKRYPATVNDDRESGFAASVIAAELGPAGYRPLPHPLFAGEDFSRVLQQVPGCMILLGAAPAGLDPAGSPNNHAADVVFDEAVLPRGAAVFAALAQRRLGEG